MIDLIVRSRRIVLPDGISPASIHVADGRIVRIGDHAEEVDAGVRIDAGDDVVLPGLVDTHVHINDPGRAEWEGFAHATRSAAAGGITTLVDMPLNSIPATTTVEGLAAKQAAASGSLFVDVGFWGGVIPGNHDHLAPLVDGGALGFKCFLSPSGVDEFPNVSATDLDEAMPRIAALGVPLLAHCELPALLRAPDGDADPRRHDTWLATRPVESEHAAIDLLVERSRQHGTRIHVVHLASADALPPIRAARTQGVPLTVETCPHYLTFAAEEIPDRATAFKCAPPIRSRYHREGLWRGLADGDIDLVVTDHSPAPPSLKCLDAGDFMRAWGGVASLQIALPVIWSGARQRRLPLERVARWMAAQPSALAGLDRKGTIAVGSDADLVIFDPEVEWIVDGTTLYHRHPITPYDGARLRGRVRRTVLRGVTVFDGTACLPTPTGRILGRDPS